MSVLAAAAALVSAGCCGRGLRALSCLDDGKRARGAQNAAIVMCSVITTADSKIDPASAPSFDSPRERTHHARSRLETLDPGNWCSSQHNPHPRPHAAVRHEEVRPGR